MKCRAPISYPLFCITLPLLTPPYRITLTKHTDRQTPYSLVRTVMGLLCGGDDVCGTVERSMTGLQASVAFVPHVVALPFPVLRTTVVVFGCSSTTGNTLTSYTLTNTVILTTTFLLTVSAGGLVRNDGLSYITLLLACTLSGHDCLRLPDYCLYLSTGYVVSVQYRTLFEYRSLS